MSNHNHEIPEDVFQSEFGGGDLRKKMVERRGEARTALTIWGIAALIGGPTLLVTAAVIIISLKECWTRAC